MYIDTLPLDAARAGRTSLTEPEGKALLRAFGVPVPRGRLVTDAAEAEAAAAALSPPFVVKVVSPEILHKSDVGGVALGLDDAGSVRTAIERMTTQPGIARARRDGFLIEETAPAGVELVIGGLRDPQFGPMIMVGLGGVFVEVMGDVAFRLCPIDAADAQAMLDDLKGAALLHGARGGTAVAVDSIVDLLVRLGGEDGLLMRHAETVAEMDVNPVIVSAAGAVAADARFILRPAAVRSSPAAPRDELPVIERFAPLFTPRTIAVVGASSTASPLPNTFIRRLKAYGYPGDIYPIHPKAEAIEGLPAYPTLAATPRPVDYAYIAIGAERVPNVIGGAAGNVRFAQVISSGFREVDGGEDLEGTLVAKAHQAGVRVVGPNCLGLYSPRGGVTFPVDAPKEVGTIGVVTQSGGLGTDIVKRGQWRGLRFSGLVTAGNSADIGPADLLEFYFADPQTEVIGFYLEDVREGRRFFDLLRANRTGKPVVILKGGRSAPGRAAAASHTGALAGDMRAWQALARQTASVLTDTVDAFLDTLLALQFLTLRPENPTERVVLFGNGGGTSVLATDFFAEQGLRIEPFPAGCREALDALELPPGTSVANPIDAPVGTLQQAGGRIAARILDIVYAHAPFDALVMHLNLAAFVGRGDVDPVDNLIKAALEAQRANPGRAHFLLALRSDGSAEIDAAKRKYRASAHAAGIPVYDELDAAARSLAAVRHLETRLPRRAAT